MQPGSSSGTVGACSSPGPPGFCKVRAWALLQGRDPLGRACGAGRGQSPRDAWVPRQSRSWGWEGGGEFPQPGSQWLSQACSLGSPMTQGNVVDNPRSDYESAAWIARCRVGDKPTNSMAREAASGKACQAAGSCPRVLYEPPCFREGRSDVQRVLQPFPSLQTCPFSGEWGQIAAFIQGGYLFQFCVKRSKQLCHAC